MYSAMLVVTVGVAVAANEGPCDILGAAGNPCFAAHSTTRALYANYNGPLYNVTNQKNIVSLFSFRVRLLPQSLHGGAARSSYPRGLVFPAPSHLHGCAPPR